MKNAMYTLLGAVAGAILTYLLFAGKPGAETTKEQPADIPMSNTSPNRLTTPDSIVAYSVTSCQDQGATAIPLNNAKEMISRYQADPNYKLMSTATQKQYGWRIDRCELDFIFDTYPYADAIQLYIAQKSDNTHTLIWVGSALTNTGNRVDLTTTGTIMDMVDLCPNNCPNKSDLPH